jgi:virginiamycin B lyase
MLSAIGLVLPIAVMVAPLSAPPAASDTLTIREWQVPWENTRPRDPYMDARGRVWFVGQRADYVAYLQPSNGQFRRFALPEGAGPHNVIVDTDGSVWYAGNRMAHIGKLHPETGEITRYPMPDTLARDPHTLIFDKVGNIWFTLQGSNRVGRLNKSTGKVDLVAMTQQGSRPYGIVVDAQNRPWFNLLGNNRIGTIDPATMQLREYELPNAEARTRRIAVTSDGRVWAVDWTRGSLWMLNPASGQMREWRSPGGSGSRPYAMTVDDQDRLWWVETGSDPNRFVGFDPRTEQFFGTTAVPSGGGTVRHMIFHAPEREIWFGTDSNTIGRAKLN